MEPSYGTETGTHIDYIISHVLFASHRSSGKPRNHNLCEISSIICYSLFVNELIFMNIYLGRIFEQAGLSMETSANEGTG